MTKQKVKKAHDTLVGGRPYPQITLVDQSEFKSLVDALDYYFTFKLLLGALDLNVVHQS